MKLDYTQKGKFIIDMVEYVKFMVKSFPEKDLHGTKVKMQCNDHLFKVGDKSPNLPKSRAEKFHNFCSRTPIIQAWNTSYHFCNCISHNLSEKSK